MQCSAERECQHPWPASKRKLPIQETTRPPHHIRMVERVQAPVRHLCRNACIPACLSPSQYEFGQSFKAAGHLITSPSLQSAGQKHMCALPSRHSCTYVHPLSRTMFALAASSGRCCSMLGGWACALASWHLVDGTEVQCGLLLALSAREEQDPGHRSWHCAAQSTHRSCCHLLRVCLSMLIAYAPRPAPHKHSTSAGAGLPCAADGKRTYGAHMNDAGQ